MLNEVVDNLLFLAVLDPQYVSGFQIDDMCGIPASVVKFELIDAQEPCLLLGLYELLAIIVGIHALETFFINLLDNVFAKPCELCHLFVGVSSAGKKITCVLVQDPRNQMAIRLKGDILAFCGAAFGAAKLIVRKLQSAQISADIKMPQIDIMACVNVHLVATGTKSFLLRDIKSPCKAINSPTGSGCFNGGFCIVEAIQAGRQE
jgi:hypothetical protein